MDNPEPSGIKTKCAVVCVIFGQTSNCPDNVTQRQNFSSSKKKCKGLQSNDHGRTHKTCAGARMQIFKTCSPLSGTSENIISFIIQSLIENLIALQEIKAIGCDETVVNTGVKGGIIRLLEEHCSRTVNPIKALSVNAEYALEKRSAHYRHIRDISTANLNRFLENSRSDIIENCRRNGMTAQTQSKLEKAFDDVEVCAGNNRIYSVPEAEFTKNINDCSKEVVRLSKACLKESQSYYPELLISMRNSVTSFLYANKDVITSNEVRDCYKKVERSRVGNTYIQCIEQAAEGVDKVEIPHSKAVACRVITSIGKCFPKMISEQCEMSDNLSKFLKIYDEFITGPCAA
ncbi:unnamed protein product [Diabrotica balteata]|uniref:Uncharacterized protein n=1 Tax=Diabrotica balteata TaxID=107213 RepID=A0A9N9XEG6_DIABA|nr:unnamed protein product [Diabrotica balteata]